MIAVGVPTVGVILTVLDTWADGPLQPLAVTLISTEPEKPVVHVITPEELIDPAAGLLTDQLRPVELVDVEPYVVVGVEAVIWQVGSAPASTVIVVGIPTVGVIFTVLITCADTPLHPFAVTCILTVPEKPFDHVITPAEDMEPAERLLNDQFKLVLLVADEEYVVVVVPLVSWQVGSVPLLIVIAVGVPTAGVIVTEVVLIISGQVPDPGIVYVIVKVPAVLVLGVISPFAEFMLTPEALKTPFGSPPVKVT